MNCQRLIVLIILYKIFIGAIAISSDQLGSQESSEKIHIHEKEIVLIRNKLNQLAEKLRILEDSISNKPITGSTRENLDRKIESQNNNRIPNNADTHINNRFHSTTPTEAELNPTITLNIAPDPEEKKAYDQALIILKDKNYKKSEVLFSDFIRNYPDSSLQSNALFWYAESFYQRQLYEKAALNYLTCYKKFPKGAKAADALLKLSITLSHLGKITETCKILHKLNDEFPNRTTTSIKRAAEINTKFGCKSQ